jgi:alanyl-tRNA synthetase
MRPQYAYFDDPLKLEFQAQVEESKSLQDGRYAVSLDMTYFYPTGGGQEHDTGTLGDHAVLDVWRDETTSRVVHVLERPLPPGPIQALIDSERRYRHMQHHSAQHLLSACFQQLFELETFSANINGFSPSTIDLPEARLTAEMFEQVENLAADIIFQNLKIKTTFVEQEQLQTVPLRRPPKVQGEVRVVEIAGFDYSACGGTHCLATGMIGMLKILKSENLSQRTRIHFMAGFQALSNFQQAHNSVSTLAEELSIHSADLVATVRKQAAYLKRAQKELRALDKLRIAKETEEMLESSVPVAEYHLVRGKYQDRPAADLQDLAKICRQQAGVITVLAARSDEKLTLIAACSDDVPLHAGNLLNAILEPLGGRGGGGPQMAQGGGNISAQQFEHLLDNIRDTLGAMI